MRPKRAIQQFSAWNYLGCEILKILEREDGPPVSSSQLATVMAVAISPSALFASYCTKQTLPLAKKFGEFYSDRPDLVLRLIQKIRERWLSDKHGDISNRFIATRPYLKESNVKSGRKRILMIQATSKEIAEAIKAKGGPRIEVATIDKARQRLCKERDKTAHKMLFISAEIHAALCELGRQGYYVGLADYD